MRTLRWRLTLFSWSLALGVALVVTVLLHGRTRRQLLQQLEKNLESRHAEVVTVLESGASYATLQEFLHIETANAPLYFYCVRDARGDILARSETLGDAALPLPANWKPGDTALRLQTEPNPVSPRTDHVRLRSQRVRLAPVRGEPTTVVIQTAVSLGPFEGTMRESWRNALLVASVGLVSIFFLLWFVTMRALQPVAAMTRKASQITATNLRERLPYAGRGDELDELARVLNDMLDRLRGSLVQMEQFSSDAAHQLRTPLTRIRGELDLVLRSEVPDSLRSHHERIREEIDGMSRLCGRLLLLARLDQQAGSAGAFDEHVALEGLVSDVVEQMTPVAQDRGVNIRSGPTSEARVLGSRPLLVEALLNLLDNAIRVTPPAGTVAVSMSSNGEVQVSVEDSGPGVPPEERERVFQRFYRLRRASPDPMDDGCGLGLAIVAGIAKAHGGRVELLERPGCGSVFRLVLPRDTGFAQ